MSTALLNGERVVSCEINRPLDGAWHALLELDAPVAPTGRATLTIDGGLVLSGTVVNPGNVHSRITLRLVGGAGGLAKELPAKPYRGTSLRVVATDILRAAGETLSESSDPAVTGRTLASWNRAAGPCSSVLSDLLRPLGAIWRTLADGTIWVGVPKFPARTLDHELLDEDPVQRTLVLVTDDPTLDANVTIDGKQITYVRTTIDGSAMRVEASFARRSLFESIVRTIENLLGPRLDMRAAYPCRIVVQHPDGSLDLVPDSKRIPQLTQVPVRYGIPGVSAKVRPGARVFVEFLEGDPSKPAVTGWETSSVIEIQLAADLVKLGDGTRGVACIGDSVVVLLTAAAVASLTTGTASLPITGYILRGSAIVKAG